MSYIYILYINTLYIYICIMGISLTIWYLGVLKRGITQIMDSWIEKIRIKHQILEYLIFKRNHGIAGNYELCKKTNTSWGRIWFKKIQDSWNHPKEIFWFERPNYGIVEFPAAEATVGWNPWRTGPFWFTLSCPRRFAAWNSVFFSWKSWKSIGPWTW